MKMKTVLIIVLVLIIIFAIVQVYAVKSQNGIEKYPYKVIKMYDAFEVRSYEATLFTSVKLTTGDYKKGSSQGFSVLAGYIFGGNEENKKIAMTSPVSMSLEDSMTMMFMVPKNFKKEDLPKPNQSQIEFKEEPAKKMAIVTFGGWANDKKIEDYKNQLIKALDKKGISYTNRFYFFGYNAPYEAINRKNEVVVELH
jgi:hypothetical protein